jgi:hypothetical protein
MAELHIQARYVIRYDETRFQATPRGSLLERSSGREFWAEPVLATVDQRQEAMALTAEEVGELQLRLDIQQLEPIDGAH